MTHTIVYLDQNYLSNMAKARIGRIKDDDQAKFWLSLFNDLKKAVLADKIACPELEFQRHEASYDRRLEEPIRKVIDEISWGLKFHLSTQILESQIYDAAKNFMGKQPEERKPWAIAFRSNPHAPIESRTTDIWGIKGRVNVHLPYLYEVVEHDRQLKSQFANDAESQKYDYTDLDWPDVVKAEKISFIISLFGLQAKDMIYEKLHSNSWLEQSIAVSLHAEFKKRW